MRPNKRNFAASVIGAVGSLMGFYLWVNYIPPYYGETTIEWMCLLRLEHVIFLYIPSSMALVASIFHKTHLMFLSFLLSLPVTKFLGVNGFIDTFPLNYYPLICYLISNILMINFPKKAP